MNAFINQDIVNTMVYKRGIGSCNKQNKSKSVSEHLEW